ncbi:ATP-binding cassette sub- G member 2 [Balamuthia mandrillaris]
MSSASSSSSSASEPETETELSVEPTQAGTNKEEPSRIAAVPSSSSSEDESDSDEEQPPKEKKREVPPSLGELPDDVSIFDSRAKLRTSTFGEGKVKITDVLPVTISFSQLYFTVKVKPPGKNPFRKTVDKTILHNLHGCFRPGEVTAIIGPSGAGKTTLLNILAGRVQSGKIDGNFLINGRPRKQISLRKWRKLSAYIMQDDVLLGFLTPQEAFTFSARLRLPGGVRGNKRQEKVQSLIEELGLEECSATHIGSVERRGISGGQRKRTSIGMELITDPSVLFLDEPTSGLDSSTAFTLVETLKKLAMARRTIITTIHQPSSDILALFDRLILMTHGNIIYNGPPSKIVPYFASIGYKCPKYTNPAEYIMDLAKSDSHISSKSEGKVRVRALVRHYRETKKLPPLSDEELGLGSLVEGDLTEDEGDEPKEKEGATALEPVGEKSKGEKGLRGSFLRLRNSQKEKKKKKPIEPVNLDSDDEGHGSELGSSISRLETPKSPNWLFQLMVLTWRSLLTSIRNPMLTTVRFIQTLVLGLLVGVLYFDLSKDQESVQDRQGALFFIVVNQAMGSMMTTLVMFPEERGVFIREHSSGAYGTLAYFLSKSIADLPFMTVFPIIFCLITYWMVGLDADVEKFFIFLACVVLVAQVAQSLGLAISAGAPDMGTSMALAPLVFIPLMLTGGLFLNQDSVPDWLRWIQFLSLFKYGFEILVLNEFDGLVFTCTQAERDRSGGNCPVPDGETAIENLNFDTDFINIWSNFLLLLLLFFFFRIIAYLSLVWIARKKS